MQVYDRVWDFAITLVVIHVILTACVSAGEGMGNGEWWGATAGGGVLLAGIGYGLSDWYWGMVTQERLNGKIDAVDGSGK